MDGAPLLVPSVRPICENQQVSAPCMAQSNRSEWNSSDHTAFMQVRSALGLASQKGGALTAGQGAALSRGLRSEQQQQGAQCDRLGL